MRNAGERRKIDISALRESKKMNLGRKSFEMRKEQRKIL